MAEAERIAAFLDEAPLRAVDEIIEASGQSDEVEDRFELLTLLSRGVLLHTRHDAEVNQDDPLGPLFDVHLPPSTRATIAAVLWRAIDAMPFDQADHHRVIDIFDDVYGKTRVYGELGLQVRDQAFKKLSAMRDASAKFFAELEAISGGIASLDQFGRGRQAFMRHLNSTIGAALFQPFLTRKLHERASLDRLFGAIGDVASAAPQEMVAKRDIATVCLREYIEECDSVGTRYSRMLAQFGHRLSAAVDEHLRTSPAAQSARLSVVAVDKKHALQNVGGRVILGLLVSNEGPGHAFDVRITLDTDVIQAERGEQYLGDFPPGTRVVDIACLVLKPVERALIYAHVVWHGFGVCVPARGHRLE